LSWESTDDNITYDLSVWEYIMEASIKNEVEGIEEHARGRVVYSREGVKGNSHKIEKTLNPYTRYFWSVKKSGTNKWSTFNYYFFASGKSEIKGNHFVFFETGGLDNNVSNLVISNELDSKKFIPAKGRANIYITHNLKSVFIPPPKGCNFIVTIDGRQLGGMVFDTYHWISIEAGPHVIIISSAVNTDTIELGAVEGKNYFFDLKINAIGGVELEEMDEKNGKEVVLKNQLITLPL
jgi:hypothetical protein